MRIISIFNCTLLLTLILASCNNSKADQLPNLNYSVDTNVCYPYGARYSAGFNEGKTTELKIALDFWKEYETGDIMNLSRYFSDTIWMVLPDRDMRGPKASVLKEIKERRERYKYMQCYIDSWMPVISKDQGDDIVFIWGTQDGTTLKGIRDNRMIHEIWWFDKKGRIKGMKEYITKPH